MALFAQSLTVPMHLIFILASFVTYNRIPHLRKCILRTRATETLQKVLIYQEVSNLNKSHFLMHSLILIKFIRNWHHNHRKGPIGQKTSLDSFLNSGFLNAVSGNILTAPAYGTYITQLIDIIGLL